MDIILTGEVYVKYHLWAILAFWVVFHSLIPPIPLKNCKRSETTTWAGITWPKFSSTNAAIRHKMPASETRDFITHGNSNNHSVSIYMCSLSTNSQRTSQTEPDDTCTCNGVQHQKGTVSLENMNLLKKSACLNFAPEGDIIMVESK